MAGRRIELFYDVVSPYSYFAVHHALKLRSQWNVNLVLRPFFLGGVMAGAGNKPPISVPAKGSYMAQDLRRESELLKIPVTPPAVFPANTVQPMRMLLKLYLDKDFKSLESATLGLFDAYWGRGENVSDLAIVKAELKKAGLSDALIASLVAASATDEIKNALKAATQEALDRGSFGAPTLIVYRNETDQGEFFFGSDRFHQIAHYLGVRPLTAHL